MRKYLAVALLLFGLLAPSTALAVKLHPVGTKGADPVHDCVSHNALTKKYSTAQLKQALATMPSSVRDYTSCQNILENQLNQQLGKKVPGQTSSGSGGGGSSVLLIVIIAIVVIGGALGAFFAYRRGKSVDQAPGTPADQAPGTPADQAPGVGAASGPDSDTRPSEGGSEDPTQLQRPDNEPPEGGSEDPTRIQRPE